MASSYNNNGGNAHLEVNQDHKKSKGSIVRVKAKSIHM